MPESTGADSGSNRGLDADVIALQEVVRGKERSRSVHEIAKGLSKYNYCFGRPEDRGSDYGNAVLSRFLFAAHQHYDITASWRELGMLASGHWKSSPAESAARPIQCSSGHGIIERRRQAQILVDRKLFGKSSSPGTALCWETSTSGHQDWTTKLLKAHLRASTCARICDA